MSQLNITKDVTTHIANLCKLNLTPTEIDTLTQMFGSTLDYIKILNELDVSNVTETFQVNGLLNKFQEADLCTTLNKTQALSNAKQTKDDLFATSAVFERSQ